MGSESRTRSLTKMVTYRIVIVILSFAITYYFTGDAGQTTTISAVFNVAGSIVYYAYERMWGAIEWGKLSAPEPSTAHTSVPPTLQTKLALSEGDTGALLED
jgi:uncharacterized membrane protein